MFQSVFSALSNLALHKRVLLLAIPMVLSNITVPLLGLVDAAVIGHLEHAWYLGGVALGGTMISTTFWLLGFLRMATTGLTAQAYGKQDPHLLALVFVQGVLMALLFSLVFLSLHYWVSHWIFEFSSASDEVKRYGLAYFMIRAWSAPAALVNYVVLGWLLGTQNAKAPMWMVIIANLTNIGLDILFVVGLGWQVEGAALASVIADYVSLLFGLWAVSRIWRRQQLIPIGQFFTHKLRVVCHGLGRFLRLNRDIFLRSLCLQVAFGFMTFQGASYGDDVVAANAVLMSFLMIISYGMDGFAYAMEALVGKAVGAKDHSLLSQSIIGIFFWSLLVCLLLTLAFQLFGDVLIQSITNISQVQSNAEAYLIWLVAMPLSAMWCFLLDGIFIGATKGREMRNSMFVAMCTFFLVFALFQPLANHALWMAMLSFMLMRGLSLGAVFFYQWRRGSFLI